MILSLALIIWVVEHFNLAMAILHLSLISTITCSQRKATRASQDSVKTQKTLIATDSVSSFRLCPCGRRHFIGAMPLLPLAPSYAASSSTVGVEKIWGLSGDWWVVHASSKSLYFRKIWKGCVLESQIGMMSSLLGLWILVWNSTRKRLSLWPSLGLWSFNLVNVNVIVLVFVRFRVTRWNYLIIWWEKQKRFWRLALEQVLTSSTTQIFQTFLFLVLIQTLKWRVMRVNPQHKQGWNQNISASFMR